MSGNQTSGKGGGVVTWASLRTQESRLRPGGPSRKQCSTT